MAPSLCVCKLFGELSNIAQIIISYFMFQVKYQVDLLDLICRPVPSKLLLGCLCVGCVGCDKLTRGHENLQLFTWMFQHLFGTENPKPPRCISSICAERFQKLTQRRSELEKQNTPQIPSWEAGLGGVERCHFCHSYCILFASFLHIEHANIPTFLGAL